MEPRRTFPPNRARLERIAVAIIDQIMRRLPPELREASQECAIETAWGAELGEDAELLGYFSGRSRLEPAPENAEDLPRILLFLDHLWDFADRSVPAFENEVATTLLHELGHYLGLDEEEIAERGLE
mgnify:CR=1 FL=1